MHEEVRKRGAKIPVEGRKRGVEIPSYARSPKKMEEGTKINGFDTESSLGREVMVLIARLMFFVSFTGLGVLALQILEKEILEYTMSHSLYALNELLAAEPDGLFVAELLLSMHFGIKFANKLTS